MHLQKNVHWRQQQVKRQPSTPHGKVLNDSIRYPESQYHQKNQPMVKDFWLPSSGMGGEDPPPPPAPPFHCSPTPFYCQVGILYLRGLIPIKVLTSRPLLQVAHFFTHTVCVQLWWWQASTAGTAFSLRG